MVDLKICVHCSYCRSLSMEKDFEIKGVQCMCLNNDNGIIGYVEWSSEIPARCEMRVLHQNQHILLILF